MLLSLVEVARRNPLWAIVAAGVALRIVLAFALYGTGDIDAFTQVNDALHDDFLHVYSIDQELPRWRHGLPFWPYPPAYLPAILAASALSDLSGLPFHGTISLVPILADAAIAVAIYVYLGWRGAAERTRLAGGALVMLGPVFFTQSGYYGQIDAVAILFGVLGLMAWERRPAPMRSIDAGLLLGVGAAVKWVPALLVLPLLASAASKREPLMLVGAAVGVPALVTLPFLVADTAAVVNVTSYEGLPGRGGLSLVADPGRAGVWINRDPGARPNEVSGFLAGNAATIMLIALVAVAALLVRYRPAPIDGAVILWLAVYVFNPNLLPQYLVWGPPFFIMAGYLRQTAVLQAVAVPALVITYLSPTSSREVADLYSMTMICLWALFALALIVVVVRLVRRRRLRPVGPLPPMVGISPR